ncbi:MAG: hypothetical protein LBH12_00505, partial [Dysgonamonadaceae bacterium]|nr:hypothetical protein [Dysgonamonadaceae bacterium]
MKEKKTKLLTKNVFFLLPIILGLLLCNQAYTQVTIGAKKEPEKYSMLELISNGRGGLRLPHLTTQDRDKLEDSSSRPFADNPNRAIPFLYEGLTIYNTDTRCLEYYNAQRWVSICDGSSRMTINPAPCTQIAADGSGCDNEFTITDPDCVNGPFSFMVLVGDRYAELLDVDEWNGTFKIRFSANNSINSRSAVVRVRSTCTSLHKDFLFTQLGQSCSTSLGTAPEIKGTPAGKNITLYAGGAVYLHVDPPATQHLSELIWTRNNMEVARGVNYITVTQAGVYDVHMGTIGCNQRVNNAVTVTRSTTSAPRQVDSVVAENNGLICNQGSTVKLVTITSLSGSVRWFKNGVLQGITSPDNEVNADEGEWFAVVTDNTAWSKPSQTVAVSGAINTTARLTAPIVNFNGNFCAGGTVYLSVTNPQQGYTYTWYENNTPLATGKNYLYSVPTGVAKVVIRCRATMVNHCPAEYMATKNIVTGTIPAQPVITGNTILCNGSATLSAMVQGSGNYTYAWYKDNDSIDSGINRRQITVTSGGNYYVTVSDGCTSRAAHINIPAVTSANPVVKLLSSSSTPGTAKINDEETYSASITFG